jgi:hypothetical protein
MDLWSSLSKRRKFGIGSKGLTLKYPSGSSVEMCQMLENRWFVAQRALADGKTFLRNFERIYWFNEPEWIRKQLRTVKDISYIAKWLNTNTVHDWANILHSRATDYVRWLEWMKSRRSLD